MRTACVSCQHTAAESVLLGRRWHPDPCMPAGSEWRVRDLYLKTSKQCKQGQRGAKICQVVPLPGLMSLASETGPSKGTDKVCHLRVHAGCGAL